MTHNRVEFVDVEDQDGVLEFATFSEAAECFARMDFLGFARSAKLMYGNEVVDCFGFED